MTAHVTGSDKKATLRNESRKRHRLLTMFVDHHTRLFYSIIVYTITITLAA